MKRYLVYLLIMGNLTIWSAMYDGAPWWVFVPGHLAIGAGTGGMLPKTRLIVSGFVLGFIIWLGTNLFLDVYYEGVLFEKTAAILNVPKYLLFLLSGLVGGITGCVALLVGRLIGNMVKKEQETGKKRIDENAYINIH